jgi:hypothetical protein
MRNFTRNPTFSSLKPDQHTRNLSLPPFNLFEQLRKASLGTRCTVYAGLSLMAAVETIFWFHVLRAKFFTHASQAERDKADALLVRVDDAIRGYHHIWMMNYGRYYGAHVWGLESGETDG